MKFNELAELIFSGLKPILENSNGLAIFARERAKFEGWLKVELCGIMSKHFKDVTPKKQRVDVCFGDWGIELKTVNTNIRYSGVRTKTRPITKNTQGIINDIDKLLRLDIKNRAILFVTFPIEPNNIYWQKQLKRISNKLTALKMCPFTFKGGVIKGVVYLGLV